MTSHLLKDLLGPIDLPPNAIVAVVRHLAYASGELARRSDLVDADLARFRAAEATFRSQADDEWVRPGPPSMGPAVAIPAGEAVTLVELLGRSWQRHGRPFPGRAIDPEMVEAATQILCELAWKQAS